RRAMAEENGMRPRGGNASGRGFGRRRAAANPARPPQGQGKRKAVLNENYAREIMELHTLGVDGGYTQKDVTELARCLTGWTLRGPRPNHPPLAALCALRGA